MQVADVINYTNDYITAGVAHALVRSASALMPTLGASGGRGVEKSLDTARTSACATLLPLSDIPVRHLGVVPGLGQIARDLVRHHHRAVVAAGAAKGDGQVTLAFADIVRQQVNQQVRNAAGELHRLRE